MVVNSFTNANFGVFSKHDIPHKQGRIWALIRHKEAPKFCLTFTGSLKIQQLSEAIPGKSDSGLSIYSFTKNTSLCHFTSTLSFIAE